MRGLPVASARRILDPIQPLNVMENPPRTDATPAPTPVSYLMAPLRDLGAWARYFRDTEIPVLAATSMALEALRAMEDEVDAVMLSEVIQRDPLMTLKLMKHVSAHRRPGISTDTETITSSLLMMGIGPFFRDFGLQPTVEDRLHDQPLALEGLHEVLRRAERAGMFALGFAVHRADLDAVVIQLAAFLHDFADMLMWCHAPTLQLEIRAAQRANPALRTASIQRSVLHIELNDLRQALMEIFRLPELLVHISDGRHLAHTNVRNVVLAVRVARHTMQGWDNAGLPDDIKDIAQLLNASPRVTLAFLHKVDASL
jgi:HD-like signal output (HDOD) protein